MHYASHNVTIFQLNGRRVPLELKLQSQVQIVPGVIRLVDFYEHSSGWTETAMRLNLHHFRSAKIFKL